MIYCSNCGEKISTDDSFCPFCGISVAPIISAEENISLEQTVAVSSSELEELKKNARVEEKESSEYGNEQISPKEEPKKTEENAEFKAVTLLSDELNETAPETTEDSSGEQPSIVSDSKQEIELEDSEIVDTLGVIIPDNAPNEEESVQTESEIADEIPKTELSSEESSQIENNEIEEVLISDSQPENVEFRKAENKISEPDEPLELGSENDISALTEAYTADDVQDIKENKIYSDALLKSILDDDSSSEVDKNPIPELESEIQQSDTGQRKLEEIADKINIPESPLEESENRNTQFDSVRIIEDDEPEAVEVEEENSGSYTTPNFAKNNTDGKKGLQLKPLEEGTVLNNRYEIIRKIGGGGMGAVYMATDKNLGETLRAVKEMVQSYIEESQQEKAIDDFKREATILTTLDHPAIPTIYDYFYDETEGRFYLVMKYISGGDLAQRLRSAPEGRIDEISVVEWAIQIADVLDYLHNLQPAIVYRDLKPANVMLDSNSGRVMLIDFGIARSINKEEKGVTAVGTMGYAPPELFSGNVEPRSDIYSLGSTIFHLLTGADPQSNPLLIFDFQKHPRPRQINPSLTDQMEKIIMRSVEYNAANRFASAAEMRDQLIGHLRHLKAGKVSYGISVSPASVALEDQKVFCGFCGQQIVATDMFCAFCGSKQPLAQQGIHSSDYVSPLMTAKLFVIGTHELEAPAYRLEKDINIVGRRDPITQIFPEVDLSKYDPQTKISRRHAKIWREEGKFLMEDLGSSNGTMIIPVVGESFKLRPHQPHNLINGEKVMVGDTTLHFVIE